MICKTLAVSTPFYFFPKLHIALAEKDIFTQSATHTPCRHTYRSG